MSKIDVYGLTSEDCQHLRKIAQTRLGKASVSLLAKTLLKSELTNAAPNTTPQPPVAEGDGDKCRLELRLLSEDYRYLQQAAIQQHMSANAVVISILRHHIDRQPVLSQAEVDALYQSNYQLLRIGRNLNQIARQLNAMEAAGITTAEIRQLAEVIDQHTEQVGRLLLANRARFE